MLAIVHAATLQGIDGRVIRVEVDVAPGLPGFTIVGLPDAALQEARERVRGRSGTADSPFRPAGSPSTWPRRTCARRARRSTWRSRSGSCSARSRSGPAVAGRSSASCRSAATCGRAGDPADGRCARPAEHQPDRRPRRCGDRGQVGRRRLRCRLRCRVMSGRRVARGGRRHRPSGRLAATDRGGAGPGRAGRRGGRRSPAQRSGSRPGNAGPGRCPWPGAGTTGARDRPRRRARVAAERTAGLGQDPPGADDPGSAAAARRRRGSAGLVDRLGGGRRTAP